MEALANPKLICALSLMCGLVALRTAGRKVTLTEEGQRFCRALGIDVASLERGRRPLCLPCLDWSARRHHLAGALGAAILNRFFALGWARLPERDAGCFVLSVGREIASSAIHQAVGPWPESDKMQPMSNLSNLLQ